MVIYLRESFREGILSHSPDTTQASFIFPYATARDALEIRSHHRSCRTRVSLVFHLELLHPRSLVVCHPINYEFSILRNLDGSKISLSSAVFRQTSTFVFFVLRDRSTFGTSSNYSWNLARAMSKFFFTHAGILRLKRVLLLSR